MPMDRLLEEITHDHFLNPPATLEEVESFERAMGWRLDPDLRAFYLHCNGATLFQRPNSPCRLRALSQIRRARVDMRGSDTDEWGPASWYVIGDLTESDSLIIDVGAPQHERYPIIDGFHEAMLGTADCPRIANSFAQFLEQFLRSGGKKFWLSSSGV
jgi:SMI1 / KNR4 family (SUKH-1)